MAILERERLNRGTSMVWNRGRGVGLGIKKTAFYSEHVHGKMLDKGNYGGIADEPTAYERQREGGQSRAVWYPGMVVQMEMPY